MCFCVTSTPTGVVRRLLCNLAAQRTAIIYVYMRVGCPFRRHSHARRDPGLRKVILQNQATFNIYHIFCSCFYARTHAHLFVFTQKESIVLPHMLQYARADSYMHVWRHILNFHLVSMHQREKKKNHKAFPYCKQGEKKKEREREREIDREREKERKWGQVARGCFSRYGVLKYKVWRGWVR